MNLLKKIKDTTIIKYITLYFIHVITAFVVLLLEYFEVKVFNAASYQVRETIMVYEFVIKYTAIYTGVGFIERQLFKHENKEQMVINTIFPVLFMFAMIASAGEFNYYVLEIIMPIFQIIAGLCLGRYLGTQHYVAKVAKQQRRPLAMFEYRRENTQLYEKYIKDKKMNLDESDFERLNWGQLAEIWRHYLNYVKSHVETKEDYQRKTTLLVNKMIEKMLADDEIYIVYNAISDEPHLYCKATSSGSTIYHSRPYFRICPIEYVEVISPSDVDSIYQIKRLNAYGEGGSRQAILELFMRYGADALALVSTDVILDKADIIERLRDSSVQDRILNPSIMKYYLLCAQMHNVTEKLTDEEWKAYNIYRYFMEQNSDSAVMLLPVHGNIDADGNPDIQFAINNDNQGQQIAYLFTDIESLRKRFDESWNYIEKNMAEVLAKYAVYVNARSNDEGVLLENHSLRYHNN